MQQLILFIRLMTIDPNSDPIYVLQFFHWLMVVNIGFEERQWIRKEYRTGENAEAVRNNWEESFGTPPYRFGVLQNAR